jgi:FkbM family methyltransferase
MRTIMLTAIALVVAFSVATGAQEDINDLLRPEVMKTHLHLPNWFLERGVDGYRDPSPLSQTEILQGLEKLLGQSVAQDKEDFYLILRHYANLMLPMPRRGLFMEIGALDGTKFSNTRTIERVFGWRGVLVEPSPGQYKILSSNRPDNILAPFAMCSKVQQVHYVMGDPGDAAVNGIAEFMPETFRQRWHPNLNMADLSAHPVIQCLPLRNVLETVGITHFDFFSLDVEGAEFEVLKTLDLTKVTFDVVLVESDTHNPTKNEAVRDLLEANGYTFRGNHLRSDWFVRSALLPANER